MSTDPHDIRDAQQCFGPQLFAALSGQPLKIGPVSDEVIAALKDEQLERLCRAAATGRAQAMLDADAFAQRESQFAAEAVRRLVSIPPQSTQATPAVARPHKADPNVAANYDECRVIELVKSLRSAGDTWPAVAHQLNLRGLTTQQGRHWKMPHVHGWSRKRGAV